jgi:hypothetical protein
MTVHVPTDKSSFSKDILRTEMMMKHERCVISSEKCLEEDNMLLHSSSSAYHCSPSMVFLSTSVFLNKRLTLSLRSFGNESASSCKHSYNQKHILCQKSSRTVQPVLERGRKPRKEKHVTEQDTQNFRIRRKQVTKKRGTSVSDFLFMLKESCQDLLQIRDEG